MSTTRAKPFRVAGHTLYREGADAGNGVGLCSCGEASPPLLSDKARRRWHREHKNKIVGGGHGGLVPLEAFRDIVDSTALRPDSPLRTSQ